MLLPDTYESLPDELSSILNVAEDWLISEIVRKIKKNEEIIASADYQFLMLNEATRFKRDYRKVLAEKSKLGLEKIDEIFKQAAESSHMFDKRIYEAKGIPFVEYKDNPWLQQITEAAANQSKGKFKNLTKTVGFTTNKGEFLEPREFFIRKMSEAELQVGMGITSYNEMIKRTVKELVNSGMKSVEYPNVRPRSVESAVRANVLTGVSDLSGEIGWKHIEELGLTIVETSAHHNARPSHVVWQGKRFALNGTVAEIRAKAEAIREENKGVNAMRKAEKSAKVDLQKDENSSTIKASGGEPMNTGASGAIPRWDIKRQNKHAELYYDEIRKRSSDVESIAKNTDFLKKDIEKIKNHIFNNKYELGGDEPTSFDPDYDMAVSWQRLIEGKNIQEMDIVMLKHELMEYELMEKEGMSYYEAHKITEKTYNYSKYILELNRKEGL